VHSAERFGRIVLPPRTGETAIAACIARQLRLPATFLVPTKARVEQTASEVESWLGEPVGPTVCLGATNAASPGASYGGRCFWRRCATTSID
jgi:superfamily II DNA or RNA helicase